MNLTNLLVEKYGKRIIITNTSGKVLTDMPQLVKTFGKKFTDSIEVISVQEPTHDTVIVSVTI